MTEYSLEPCPYMRSALERLARGEKGCLWLWYARIHTIRCPRCRRALDALKKYFDLIRPEASHAEPVLNWERLDQGLDAAESRREGPVEPDANPSELRRPPDG